MHETHFPESKALVSAAYEDETQELTIRLRTGRTYIYRGVEPYVYDALRAAESAGQYYNLRIRDDYPYAEIVPFERLRPRLRCNGTMPPAPRPIDPSRGGRARRLQSRRARRG